MRIFSKLRRYFKQVFSRENVLPQDIDRASYNVVARWDLSGRAAITRASEAFCFGGYSDVYRGTMRQRHTPTIEVAVKVLRFHGPATAMLDRRHFKRLYAEVDIWSRLDHPNIAEFSGFTMPSRSNEMPTVISPWYGRGNIVKWLENGAIPDRLVLLLEVVSGVTYLHSNHIVHGDIKAENVLLDNSAHARLCDFGLSHFTDDYPNDLSHSVQLSSFNLGYTLHYSSPELLSHSRSTRMSDIWALGCLGMQILTNQIPYGHLETRYEVKSAIRTGQLPFHMGMFSARNDSEKVLLQFIRTCWDTEPPKRPSATQFLGIVEQLITSGLKVEERLVIRTLNDLTD
ncbi:hypothetical protein FRC03_000490 [Tulasnella sp. 419]|nr:hypothetical protein FRC03_000490 [Tulasnella sp. 419]